MTQKPDDGGSAFPTPETETVHPQWGMSLRDYFAAKVAAGILAGGWADTVPLDDVEHARQLAGFAYQAADAMLDERKK